MPKHGGSGGRPMQSQHRAAPPAKKPAFVYSLNLSDCKKYVGHTSNPAKRLAQHFSGKGSQWTQKNPPVSVININKCSSLQAAKNAEKIVYHRMANYHGIDKVRGAGHTNSK